MRLKIDENLPVEAAALLREEGHDAVTVREQGLGGTSDVAVEHVCRREGRGLITLDLDFADIRTYPPAEHSGLVVLRLARQDKPHVLETIRRLLPLLRQEPLAARLWIVDEQGVRMRGSEE
jgi:predicted nuclease of predicted toxin-antitoxin system